MAVNCVSQLLPTQIRSASMNRFKHTLFLDGAIWAIYSRLNPNGLKSWTALKSTPKRARRQSLYHRLPADSTPSRSSRDNSDRFNHAHGRCTHRSMPPTSYPCPILQFSADHPPCQKPLRTRNESFVSAPAFALNKESSP